MYYVGGDVDVVGVILVGWYGDVVGGGVVLFVG